MDADELSSGTIPDDRFPATLPVANGSNLTNLTSGNLVGALPAIDGSALLNLPGGSGGPPAASADTLTTTRTIWGQNFNGSQNVSGNLTGVGNITGTNANMTIQPLDSTSTRNVVIRGNNDTNGTGGAVFIGESDRGAINFRTGSRYSFSKVGDSAIEGILDFDDLTGDRRFTFPNTTGTVALTSSTVTNANNINVDEKSDNVDYQVLFSDNQGSGYQRPYIDSGSGQFKYNPSTNTLTAGFFVGDGSGLTNVPGGSGGPAAAEADKLSTARTLWGQSFDGTANVTGSMTLGGNITPDADGTRNLGSNGTRWNNVYSDNANITSTLNVRGAIDLADNDQIRLGSSDDAKLFYDGTNNTFELELESAATSFIITNNGNVTTTITKAGDITAASFTGDGSGLTNVPGGSGGPPASSADTLTNTRTLWGQNFNGSANVSGNLTGVGNITLTGTVDGRNVLDDGQAGDNLVTLSGVARDATNLGSFSGSILSNSETIKSALQDLETALESTPGSPGGPTGGEATTLNLTTRNTNSGSHYLTFSVGASGQENQYTDSTLRYQPSSDTLSSGNFSGNGSSLSNLNASSLSSGTLPDSTFPATLPAVSGANLTNLPGTGGGGGGVAEITVSNESTDTTCFAVFTLGATGDREPKTNSNFLFNSSSGQLRASSFRAATFTNPGGVTLSATGSASDLTAQAGDNLTIIAGAESAGTLSIRHSGGSGGLRMFKSSSSTISGRMDMELLTANRTYAFPDGSGTVALTNSTVDNSVNADTATNANNINVADESSDTTCFPVFTTTATGNRPPKTNGTTLQYNASTGLFSSTAFAGNGSALTNIDAAQDGVFYENNTNVTQNYTITTGKNAMSAGPVEIDTGVTVTVPTGSAWTIV